jgi:hypothetical protein
MSGQTLTCPECGNTSNPQPLAGPDVRITCRLEHLHKTKRPVEMEEATE